MDQEYISDRKPISLLQKEEPLITETDKYEELLTTFDMYRSVGDTYWLRTCHFSYLEHLLRLTTPSAEIKEFLSSLDLKFCKWLHQILKINKSSQSDALKQLQFTINKSDLDIIEEIKSHLITYKIKRKRLCRYEEENDDKMRPYAYILVSKSGTYILYTPLMTFIDGYDPYTGHKISPFITPDILKSSFRKFYYNHSQNLKNPKVFNGTFGQQKKGMLVFIASDAKELKDKIDPLKIKDVLGRIESSVDVSKSYKEEFDIYSDDDISIEEISQKSGFISDVSFLRSAREDISIRSTSPVKETEVELDFNHPEFKNTAKAELVEFPYERRYEYISIDWKQTQKKITKSRDYCGADSCLIF